MESELAELQKIMDELTETTSYDETPGNWREMPETEPPDDDDEDDYDDEDE